MYGGDVWSTEKNAAKSLRISAPWCTPAAAKGAKAIAIAALLYVVSPIDAIPDIIPGLGLIDDAGIVGLAIKMLMDEIKKRENKQ